MYWVDIITIVVALILIYKSYQQGLLNSAVRLAGLVIGIIIAANLGSWASDVLLLQFNWSKQIADIVGYILIFLLVILAAQIAGYFLRTVIHAIKLGWLDRIGGLFLGALKAAIVMSLLFWLLLAIPSESLSRDLQEKSFSYKMLADFAPSLYEKLVQSHMPQGGVRDRLDVLLSSEKDSLSMISSFENELKDIEGVDQSFVDEMKVRFKQLPPSKKISIMDKLSKKDPDLNAIIEILYSERP
ncbi:MAG: CvpA family protein [Fidelibacterota bacterium]